MPGEQQQPSETEWAEWHAAREEALADRSGWLTLTSFQWLPDEPGGLDLIPGLWSSSETTAAVTTDGGDGFRIDEPAPGSAQVPGQHVSGTITARLSNGDSLMWLRHEDVVVELAMRSDRYAIRTRDADASTLANFDGVPTFDYSPGWVLTGQFLPYPEPRHEEVASAREDVTIGVMAAGEVEFEYDGGTHRLAATSSASGSLVLNFHDDTNGDTTADWRFVQIPAPDDDGTMVIDFNRTINYPFSFTDFGACPAPVEKNRLEFAVDAGEMAPRDGGLAK
ncbi:DUF1684 domain-containing protein [Arthrobacter castelli]|uniref:DUF1684 domain-containing protein n=1 Tax=Arthrobacter castelli TaxID=271431 RepID=UPI00040CC5D1|nr:DUF1684 domain-containing protein [Arthrobacter castelli]